MLQKQHLTNFLELTIIIIGINETKELQIQYSIEEHDCIMQFTCFNQACKQNRIYCFNFLRNGYHVSHPKDQYDLNKFIEFSDQIRKDCEDLIQRLCLEIGNIKKILIQLNQGLRIKYQLQKERIFKLDAKQLNQTFDEMFKYNEITQILLDDVKQCSNVMIIQLKKQTIELKLYFNRIDRSILNYLLTIEDLLQLINLERIRTSRIIILNSMMKNMKKQYNQLIMHYQLILVINNHYIRKLTVQVQLFLNFQMQECLISIVQCLLKRYSQKGQINQILNLQRKTGLQYNFIN
ncbi:unnamed protein product [Paramecium pentaurelia]|uniref:Uncharacterized protein n=1 Tax=Paramecium pentaurelia TaxID=43138 RepID=A0A8S1XQN9_9CILI|nr:unnamed protein product [Paramecium pentaurelia]